MTDGALEVHAIHFGAPLDEAARESLGRVVSDDLGIEATVTVDSIPTGEIDLTASGPAGLAQVAAALVPARRAMSVQTCVTLAKPPGPRVKVDPAAEASRVALKAMIATHPRVTVAEADHTTVRFVEGPCEAGD